MTVHSRSSGVIHGLDGRPVIDALRVLVGDLLIRRADTLRDHVMFVDVTDTQNSRLLPICSIDLRKGEIALGTEKLPDTLVLALRSPDAAFDDLDTTLKALGAGRGHEASRGLALHYASDRRRTGLFAPGIHEPEIVKRALGHTPVIGASFGHVAFGEQVHALSSVTAVIG